ncbi:hypothetical protein [Leptospira noguchii]|uniref:Uncharacterized protein n=3 Tax=Leptospira noguchii TaxID=28182 RepID=A0A9Q8RQ78_9LEPT|nr:hypothetical protein [Leptospira noguchii]EMO27617.1 hypothetical protein LEP1GSC170_4411 [Leptospira interrogans serovar Bataviae str. HAI135]EKR75465.1 hypothetical protein LEP1GSC041_3694 [Leptospira noguchii str. 2006001870]EMM99638.1 hypothetical protein LEP1GSC035_1543 [Leptospira noguchii str. 2007001578]EMO87945.1 hypothetical protein LEP1GSC024_0331 [Leptospira noguchii str. 2001034031]TQE66004.1 hypothetical protein FF021_19010 [Leptospira noguchii]
MRESNRTKKTLRLLNPPVSELEREEMLFQERIEIFWKKFQDLSSSEKKEKVKGLLSSFHKYQKRMETLLFQWKNLFEKEQEIKRKLRTIGERTRGIRKF